MNGNFEPDEKDFLAAIQPSLTQMNAVAGPCPPPDLVIAVAADPQTHHGAPLLAHIEVCGICQQLIRDFSEYDHPGVSEDEDRRIRARWEDRVIPLDTSRRSRVGWVYAIGTVAAAAIIVFSVLAFLRQSTQRQIAPTAANEAASVPSLKSRTTFVLSKAAIKVPATAVLTFRSGGQDTRAFLEEFALALAPYRSDDFAEAERRLEQLATKYPDTAAVHFYLGVSRLFLNQNTAAMRSLESARGMAQEDLRDDVAWYLALCFDRAGRTDDARREVQSLCSRNGEYQKRACSALDELKVP